MITISLEGIKVKAPIGFYEAERILKREFLVDVKVWLPFGENALADEISNTLNYEILYSITQEKIQQPVKLIETVAAKIATEIQLRFPAVEQIWIRIAKPNPMMKGRVNQSSIEYSWHKDKP